MPSLKNTPEMLQVLKTRAERLYREPFPSTFPCKSGEEARYLYSQIKGMPTSTHGDAALDLLELPRPHRGRAPEIVHPSRGHSYRVMHRGSEYLCTVSNPYDHRGGVVATPKGA